MSFIVTVQPSGHSFDVNDGETVLDAALRHGFSFPYGCRSGFCGACRGKLLAGEIQYEDGTPPGLSAEEVADNQALYCQAFPTSDISIEIREISATKEIPVKTLPCRIAKEERLSADVMQVFLKLPVTERLQFLAGQYIDILMEDGKHRSFSLANAPHDDAFLELHIRHIEGGRFTDQLFGGDVAEKSILRIEGPHGNFFLREDSERPIILMAGGTGFAPIKGIIEHAIAAESERPMYLYWGARTRSDLYMHTLAQRWADEYAHIHYIPVLSDSIEEDNWEGRDGYVTDAIMADFDDLSGFDIYAGGSPAMVYAGRDAFVTKGMDETHYFSDAFEIAGD